MAFNGSGVFVRIMNWVQDKTNAINITASRMDTDSNDFAAAFNNCVTRDNQGKPSASFLPSADASFDLGSSGFHWRDLWASRNASIGGTLTVTGAQTFTGAAAFNGGLTGTTANLSGAATSAGVVLGANDSSGRGIAICRYKAGNTSRANNTLASDPDLTFAIPAAGTYAVLVCMEMAAAGGGGLNISMVYSGTYTAAASCINAWGFLTGVLHGANLQFIGNGAQAWATAGAGSNSDTIYILGSLTATGAGTLALQWAQNTTNASAAVLGAGSYMTVTQLS